MFGHNCSKGFY